MVGFKHEGRQFHGVGSVEDETTSYFQTVGVGLEVGGENAGL